MDIHEMLETQTKIVAAHTHLRRAVREAQLLLAIYGSKKEADMLDNWLVDDARLEHNSNVAGDKRVAESLADIGD